MADKEHILFVEDDANGVEYIVRGYDEHSITINHTQYTHSIIATPSHVEAWEIASKDDINSTTLAPLLALKPEVIIIGVGTTFALLPASLTAPIMAQGIGIEIMDNGAAIRTYTALASEGRGVALGIVL